MERGNIFLFHFENWQKFEVMPDDTSGKIMVYICAVSSAPCYSPR